MDGSKIAAGGAAGAGVGAAIVYAAGRFGADLTAEDGALIATGLVAGLAFVTHNGIRGAFRVIWRGSGNEPVVYTNEDAKAHIAGATEPADEPAAAA